MCLQSQKRFTNSHYLSKYHSQKFSVGYPCGHCSECIRSKKSEWIMRAYYEYKSCIKNGGFMVFDTLTYKEDSIPYLSRFENFAKYTCFDCYCFDRDDLKRFLKILRSSLSRAGYDVNGRLRYLITSEFGDLHGRPHFHVLFFVTFKIEPVVFSAFVARSWRLGFTDGYRSDCVGCCVKDYCKGFCLYKSKLYVSSERVFTDFNVFGFSKASYVAKYVSKELSYDKKIRQILVHLFNIRYPNYPWRSNFECREEFRKLYRQCSNFHLQSQGFGLYALEDNKIDDVIKNGSLPFVSNKKSIVVNVPLSQYFKRKLFYEQFWFNGKRMWRLNNVGVENLLRLNSVRYGQFYDRYFKLPNAISSSGYFNVSELQKIVLDKLDGRSLVEFCDYLYYYKGRLVNPLVDDKNVILKDSISLDSFEYKNLLSTGSLWFPANHYRDVAFYHFPFVSDEPLVSYKNYEWLARKQRFSRINSFDFEKRYCWNQFSKYEFRYFDDLYDILNDIQSYINQNVDNYNLENELRKERLKCLGLFDYN